MDWHDKGLILGTRRHGETSVILELMTPTRGRHLGMVRGGRSSKMRALLQPGNSVYANWRARLEDHLGAFVVEPDCLRAATLMDSSTGTYGIQMLASHLRLLPERDPHPGLYDASLVMLEHLGNREICGQLMVRFELELLYELGFGLDLAKCADTGTNQELIYVSPKTGRAVSRRSGEPWADRMLRLPSFLRGEAGHDIQPHVDDQQSDHQELDSAFKLTGFFLDRHVYGPRGITPPSERTGFIRSVLAS